MKIHFNYGLLIIRLFLDKLSLMMLYALVLLTELSVGAVGVVAAARGERRGVAIGQMRVAAG